jgi:hypothetical protein
MVSYFQLPQSKFCTHFSSQPCVLHVQPTQSFSMLACGVKN